MLEGEEGERGGANLNALEFRKFLINRSARDRIRVAICILNISWRASPSDAERERDLPPLLASVFASVCQSMHTRRVYRLQTTHVARHYISPSNFLFP